MRFAAAEQLTPKFKATLTRWSGDVEIGFPSVGKTPPSSLTLLAGLASPTKPYDWPFFSYLSYPWIAQTAGPDQRLVQVLSTARSNGHTADIRPCSLPYSNGSFEISALMRMDEVRRPNAAVHHCPTSLVFVATLRESDSVDLGSSAARRPTFTSLACCCVRQTTDHNLTVRWGSRPPDNYPAYLCFVDARRSGLSMLFIVNHENPTPFCCLIPVFESTELQTPCIFLCSVKTCVQAW